MYQKIIISISILYWLSLNLNGQEYSLTKHGNFQQKTDYEISVVLDTSNQLLKGTGTIYYYNNSPDSLNEVYLHTFWNAFGDKTSTFAEQRLMHFDSDFHFAKEDEMGGYEKLQFRINNQPVEYKKAIIDEKEHSDILHINLNVPLATYNKLTIEFEFELKIPYAFSRGGFKNDIYRFTQWYPKLAVYDKNGWHPMPYLDVGEYYYDFGDYKIDIDVPEDFVIAYTGEVKSETINGERKTLSIEANKVTDFAWFASKEFLHQSRYIKRGGKEVALNVYALDTLNDWSSALDYLERSFTFYSDEVGEYPYPHVSIVDAGSKGGSGMEYPMITILSNDGNEQHFDHLIAHEIGHNWFYAILSTNEREFPWLDEGFNSFYDHKYNDRYYDKAVYDEEKPGFTQHDHELSGLQMVVAGLQATNWDLPISTPSMDSDLLNYGCGNYEEAAWSLKYLEDYLGEEFFRKCIQSYYKEWRFRHPGPKDVQEVFERVSERDLDWFFNSIIVENVKYDHKIKEVNLHDEGATIFFERDSIGNMPMRVDAFNQDDSLISSSWRIAGPPISELRIDNEHLKKIERVSINGATPFLDINRHNNHWFNNPNRRQNKRLNFFYKINDSRYRTTHWLPLITANAYDGLMLGGAVYNDILPGKNFKYFIQPSFGINSSDISGIFGLQKDFLLSKGGRKWSIGLHGRKFSYSDALPGDSHLDYFKVVPTIRYHFDKSLLDNRSIEYKAHYLSRQQYQVIDGDLGINSNSSIIHQLNLRINKIKRLSINKLLFQLEYENYKSIFSDEHHYLKASLEYEKQIIIARESRFSIRFFGCYFPSNSRRGAPNYNDEFTRGSFALTAQGFADQTYEQLYFARTNRSGFWSRQISMMEGGFKTAQNLAFSIGGSNDWAVAMNFKSDIPGIFNRLNIKPFLDVAWVSTRSVTADPLEIEFYWSGGVAYEFFDVVGIYLPLFESSNIEEGYTDQSFLSKISFRFNINKLNPWNAFDNPVPLMSQ